MYMYLNADVHVHVYSMYRQRATERSRKKKMNKEDMNKAVYEKAGVDYAQTSALFLFFYSHLFFSFILRTYSSYQCTYVLSQLCLVQCVRLSAVCEYRNKYMYMFIYVHVHVHVPCHTIKLEDFQRQAAIRGW